MQAIAFSPFPAQPIHHSFGLDRFSDWSGLCIPSLVGDVSVITLLLGPYGRGATVYVQSLGLKAVAVVLKRLTNPRPPERSGGFLFSAWRLSELSPGERGSLLLVFYLMLDRRDIPLVIDQPEDNLDNKSVYEILVKFLKKAKKRRQIIIVTHNPNLALVADAE